MTETTSPAAEATARSQQRGSFSALRSPNFRLYFGGQLVSISGTWMQNLAQGFLIFNLTGSELWLGIVACAAGLPVLLFSPITGVIVERIPRQRLMLVTQAIQMILAFILALLTATNTVQVWHIVLLAFLLGTTNAFDLPARQTFVVEMVGPEDLRSGIALNSVLNSASRVLGPAAAGIALVQFGPAWCFFLNGLSFLAVIASLLIMRVPFAVEPRVIASPIGQLREGLSYARRHEVILPLLMLTVLGGFFVGPIIQLLPAFADVVLNSPKEGYAWLTAGQGIGAVAAGIGVGYLALRFGYGPLIGISIVLCALANLIFAAQTTIPLASLLCVFAGLFLILQFVSINTKLQSVVENSFRGRVLALYTLSFMGVSPFGALLLGSVANLIGTQVAIAVYALLSGALGILVMWRYPSVLSR